MNMRFGNFFLRNYKEIFCMRGDNFMSGMAVNLTLRKLVSARV